MYVVAPPYAAVIEWLPLDRLEVLKFACPARFNVLDPRTTFPSRKVTVPVGTPPAEVTVAVKVTVCPRRDGLREEERVVVVLYVTLWVSDDDVLDWNLASPL